MAATTAMASTTNGNDRSASTIRMTTVSTTPPTYPAMSPRATPTAVAIRTAKERECKRYADGQQDAGGKVPAE